LFTLQFLQDLFPVHAGKWNDKLMIEEVMTDSRKKGNNALFIPIKGETFDGHDYIEQAIENGAVAALWDQSEKVPANAPESFCFFMADDTVSGMQRIANKYRNEINPVTIGITGSNGKTTTKDLVRSVLQTKRRTHATKGNFNNHIGLPLTILQMPRDTEVLVVEMGMNDFHEIDRLSRIAEPDYAFITNIGESHIEHLGSREGILKAKLEIRNGLQKDGLLFFDGDEDLLKHLRDGKNNIACGFDKENDVTISNVSILDNETKFHVDGEAFKIPLLGKHHAKNATFAIAVARQLGYAKENIIKGLLSLSYSEMRFERLAGKNGATIINDAYNASATSMKAAIEVVKQMGGFTHKIVVLGDILELGTYSKSMHRSVAGIIDFPIDYVFTYGNDAKEISNRVKEANEAICTLHFDEKADLLEELKKHLRQDTLLLFKASRGMKLEEVIQEIT